MFPRALRAQSKSFKPSRPQPWEACDNLRNQRLTEINELFDGKRRRVELRVEIQHLLDLIEPHWEQPHFVDFSLRQQSTHTYFSSTRPRIRSMKFAKQRKTKIMYLKSHFLFYWHSAAGQRRRSATIENSSSKRPNIYVRLERTTHDRDRIIMKG